MTESGLANLGLSMQGLVTSGQRAGIVWAVAKNGKLITMNAFGKRNLESGLPMETDTLFRLYSQSRPVTAVAFLTLLDEGLINLDDLVSDYLPSISEMKVISEMLRDKVIKLLPQNPEMNLRHLLTYTSGLGYARDWPFSSGMKQRDILSLEGNLQLMIDKLSKFPLLSQPGEKWMYGFHSDVLGAVAEVVSGKSFDDFMDNRLFKPLKMSDTGFWIKSRPADHLAEVYSINKTGNLVRREPVPSSDYYNKGTLFSAGGGLVSTVPDYLRFGQMILNRGELEGRKILDEKTVDLMLTNALEESQGQVSFGVGFNPARPASGYGWGFAIGVRIDGSVHTVPGSKGDVTWSGLANTTFFVDPVHQIVAVAMTQFQGKGSDDLTFRLREGVYGALIR